MAAAGSDQENGLLQCDERNPSALPPAGRLPIKIPLAVGLCVFAAGLAGAVIMGRPAARVPTKIKHPWAAISMKGFQYVSEECKNRLIALEREAEEEGRVHTSHENYTHYGGAAECKESEQTCIAGFRINGDYQHVMKCFPSICKQANLFKELEAIMADAPPEMEITGLSASCEFERVPDGYEMHADMGSGHGNTISHMHDTSVSQCADACDQLPSCAAFTMKGDLTTCTLKSAVALTSVSGKYTYVKQAGEEDTVMTREPWMQYLSDECHELLIALEKEAEAEGRVHTSHENATNYGGAAECKESEQMCIAGYKINGNYQHVTKCFPNTCKKENIKKGIDTIETDFGMSLHCNFV